MLTGELGGRQFHQTERTEHVRLSQAAFNRLWETWGEVDMDLMATDTSAQRAPIEGGLIRRRLPFYPRFHTNGTAGIDVFSHNVNHMPGPLRKYCLLLPPTTVLSESSAGEGSEVRSVQIASQGEDSQFLRYTTNAETNRTRSAEEACER